MINLLENYPSVPAELISQEEDELTSIIYRLANDNAEWPRLLTCLSNSISVSENIRNEHPLKEVSTRLTNHLKVALEINAQNNESSPDNKLDAIPINAVIINEAGRIVDINESAKKYFSESEDWDMDQDYLSAKHLRLNVELTPLCNDQHHSVISLPLEPVMKTNESLSFVKHSPRRHKLLHLTALPQNNEALEQRKLFYICFQNQKDDMIDAESLKSHFNLTDTEALLVITLMKEVSRNKATSRLKFGETRTQDLLNQIFQKLNVFSKPELLKKVMIFRLSIPYLEASKLKSIEHIAAKENHKQSYFYLQDGRKLSYFEYPKPSGILNKRATDSKRDDNSAKQTIVLLHSLVGSAKELPPGAETLFNQNNLRVIIPERPGYGDSDRQEGRTHQDWVADLEQLLDHLNIDTVKVLAHSVGCLYALALAEHIPDRVERVSMVNAIPRIEDLKSCKRTPALMSAVNRSLRFSPFLIEPILKITAGKDVESLYAQHLNLIRPTQESKAADINLLKNKRYRSYAIENLRHSSKQGLTTWVEELKLSFAETCFTPSKSKSKSKTEYQFWHGEHDDIVPIEAAEKLAKELNTTAFNRLKGETHFLFARRFNEVVKGLLD